MDNTVGFGPYCFEIICLPVEAEAGGAAAGASAGALALSPSPPSPPSPPLPPPPPIAAFPPHLPLSEGSAQRVCATQGPDGRSCVCKLESATR